MSIIIDKAYIAAVKKLKTEYSALPFYKRFWFSLWSYRLSSSLSAVNLEFPDTEQVETLKKLSEKSWFFKSIFGLLDQFKLACKSRLPEVLPQVHIVLSNHLSNQDLKAFSHSWKANVSLFEPVLDIRQFLHHVTRRRYNAVENMLKKDRTLLTRKGAITDCSNRTFTNISGFQYALWALDKHMWTWMLDCLPNDQQVTIPLIEQYREIKEIGITYDLDGIRSESESHFDFAIINQLETLVPLVDRYTQNLDELSDAWVGGVGRAQRLLPRHVVFEYLRTDRTSRIHTFSLYHHIQPTPFDFTRPPSPKSYLVSHSSNEDYWFKSNFGLGVIFAITPRHTIEKTKCPPSRCDLEFEIFDMKTLFETRKNDLKALELQLAELQLRNHLTPT